MNELTRKKEMILETELAFSNAVGAGVIEKPKISFWMIMVPIFFLYFYYRLQKFKNGRIKFNQEFMTSRRLAMDLAIREAETGQKPHKGEIAERSGVSESIEKPYTAWVTEMVEYYRTLLSAQGESFEELVRSAYSTQTEYLLTLNRLSALEKDLYATIKPNMEDANGAAEIVSIIEERSRMIRRDLAESVFS